MFLVRRPETETVATSLQMLDDGVRVISCKCIDGHIQLYVLSHSSAATGFSARQELGQVRQAQTRYLRVQEGVKERHVDIPLVRGKSKPGEGMF